jgi:hypothetical protein
MQSIQVDHSGESCLRFVFNDSVVSLNLAANATFGEIARTLSGLSSRRYGNPVAIDVTLGCGGATRGRDSQLTYFPGTSE